MKEKNRQLAGSEFLFQLHPEKQLNGFSAARTGPHPPAAAHPQPWATLACQPCWNVSSRPAPTTPAPRGSVSEESKLQTSIKVQHKSLEVREQLKFFRWAFQMAFH